jgi:hypothetical protein
MVERYIFQLKSLQPELRREAILWLSQCGDVRALEPLGHLAEHESDPQMRSLAEAGQQQVKREVEAFAALQALDGPKEVDPLAELLPGRIEPTVQDKRQAQHHLNQALSFRNARDTERALYHLAEAIRLNPLLAYEKVASTLASDLMSAGDSPRQAMTVLVRRIANGEISPPPLQLVDATSRQTLGRIALACVMLLVLLALFFTALTGQPFSPALLTQTIPQSLLGLTSLVIADLFMYLVAMLLGGFCTLLRFLSRLLTSQVPIVALMLALVTVLPVVSFAAAKDTDGAATALVTVNILVLAFGGSLLISYQTFVVWRTAHFTSDRGLFTALMGIAILFILAITLGLLKTIRIG